MIFVGTPAEKKEYEERLKKRDQRKGPLLAAADVKAEGDAAYARGDYDAAVAKYASALRLDNHNNQQCDHRRPATTATVGAATPTTCAGAGTWATGVTAEQVGGAHAPGNTSGVNCR